MAVDKKHSFLSKWYNEEIEKQKITKDEKMATDRKCPILSKWCNEKKRNEIGKTNKDEIQEDLSLNVIEKKIGELVDIVFHKLLRQKTSAFKALFLLSIATCKFESATIFWIKGNVSS